MPKAPFNEKPSYYHATQDARADHADALRSGGHEPVNRYTKDQARGRPDDQGATTVDQGRLRNPGAAVLHRSADDARSTRLDAAAPAASFTSAAQLNCASVLVH